MVLEEENQVSEFGASKQYDWCPYEKKRDN